MIAYYHIEFCYSKNQMGRIPMKNKHNRFLCVLMCIVLVASVFTACGIKGDDPTTAPSASGGWQQNVIPDDGTYTKIVIEGVELADLISDALGEEYRDTGMSELTDAEKDQLKDYANDKGYIVEEDKDGNLVIQKPAVEAPTEVVSNIFNQASVKDPSNLTPEDITRLSQVAASNNMQLVTKPDGGVDIVKPTLLPPTQAPVFTKAPDPDFGNSFETTMEVKVPVPSYNPPDPGEVAPMGTTLPKTKVAKAGWLKTYGNNDHHVFTDNAVTKDGGIVAVGATVAIDGEGKSSNFGAIVVKYSKDGKILWHDVIDADKICQLERVAVLKDGSIVAVGYTAGTKVDGLSAADYQSIGSTEGLVIKYTSDGKKQYTKTIGGSGNDMLYAISATSDGGFLIGGKSDSVDCQLKGIGTQRNKAFVMKTDANCNIKWTTALSSYYHAAVKNIAVSTNGAIYAALECIGDDGEFAGLEGVKKGLETTVLIKLDGNGKLAWKKSFYGSNRTQITSIVATSDGCVIAGQYAAGQNGNSGTFKNIHNGGNPGTFDGVVIKVGADGNQKWIKTLVGFQNDFISDITPVPGGFALSGYTNSTNRDFAIKNNGQTDAFVYIISAYGDLQTVSSFGGGSVDNARAICSNGKTVYIGGFTNSADGTFLNAEVKGAENKGAAFIYQFNLETT